jgi:glutamate N-acetyltransferase/amino-acid N-acetyltransferase
MDRLFTGLDDAHRSLTRDGGDAAAAAIMTTDSVSKQASAQGDGFTVGGMAKGAGMLAPSLATMLVVLTTDAVADATTLDSVLRAATRVTFDRVDSDGCTSTNDTVLLLSSGASGVTPAYADLRDAVTAVCADLARQLVADAEGASKEVRIDVVNAATEDDAVNVGRAVSRANLVKCAIHGEDPNWGRILAELGMTDAAFEPDAVDVAINGVWVCRDGITGEDRELVDMSGREVLITIDLRAGQASATVWTNDLTAAYVHENSAYSS